jgi:RNA polymerase sigma-70 factor, ECF subfamily
VTEPTSDEILMAAYRAGSEAAFRELFDRYAAPVYGFLVRRLGDPALSEDLFQEAFLRLHRARGSYDVSRSFRTWLFTIVHNLLSDALRTRRRAPQTKSHEEIAGRMEKEVVDGDAAYLREDGSPEHIALARESRAALESALGALPADEATVLILARIEGLTYEEIAPIVGRSAAAAKQLAYRALKRIRSELLARGSHGEQRHG